MATKVRQSPSRAEHAALTVAEWEEKGKEALVLVCDNLDLEVTGDVSTLAKRLYDSYHPAVVEQPVVDQPVEEDLLLLSEGNSDDDESDSPPSRRRKPRENNDNDAGNNGADTRSTGNDDIPTDRDGDDTQDHANNDNLAASAFQTAQANSELLQHVLDKIGLLHAERDLDHAEVRALRSDFRNKLTAAVNAAEKAGQQMLAAGKNPPSAAKTKKVPATSRVTPKQTTKPAAALKTTTTTKTSGATSKTSVATASKNKTATSHRSTSSSKKRTSRSPSQRSRSKSRSPSTKRTKRKSHSRSQSRRRSRRSSSSSRDRRHRSTKRGRRSSSKSSGNSSSSSSYPTRGRSTRRRSRSPRSHSPSRNPAIFKNLFTPAAISSRIIDLIEKMKYVDFQKLRPKSVDTKTREESASNIELKYSTEKGTYTFEKASKDQIDTFTRWMEAWNAFYQTWVYFRPRDHFLLFQHQRLICTLATQFKFSAVYSYDVDFRNLIAAQKRCDNDDRTAKWGTKHPELAVIHLTEDQRLPPAKCFKCQEKGHTANRCPNPKSKDLPRSKSPQRGSSSGTRKPRRHPQANNPNVTVDENTIDTCDHWNRGNCNRGRLCGFLHKCSNCRATNQHTGPHCDRPSASTNFRPGP